MVCMFKGCESYGHRVDSGSLFPKLATKILPLCMLSCNVTLPFSQQEVESIPPPFESKLVLGLDLAIE